MQMDGEANGFKVAKLKNAKTGNYLRIYKNGKSLCIDAQKKDDGRGTKFKIHPVHDQYRNSFAFSSVDYQGKFISAQAKGTVEAVGMLFFHFASVRIYN